MSGNFEQQDEFSDLTFDALDEKGGKVEGRLFEDCVFRKCNFGGAIFKGCRFHDCLFDSCDLSNIQVSGSVFRGTSFKDCKLIGVNWTRATSITRLSFEKSRLDLCVFVGLDLRNSKIHGCSAKEVDFADTDLSESDCRNSDFAGARFSNTKLNKADLRQAMNYSISPLGNKINKAKFSLPEATLLLYGLGIELNE